jgi:hypothetical protein
LLLAEETTDEPADLMVVAAGRAVDEPPVLEACELTPPLALSAWTATGHC